MIVPSWEAYAPKAGEVVLDEISPAPNGKPSVGQRIRMAAPMGGVFVADGGPFVSQADKNPTWTILALSLRASERIARLARGAA